jgi:hypothetical protein
VDFASHCQPLGGIVSELASLECKHLATSNSMKTKGHYERSQSKARENPENPENP